MSTPSTATARRLSCHDAVVAGTGSSPLGFVVPRRAAEAISAALTDTRVVIVVGARQCGKTTVVRTLAGDRTAEWRNLDLTGVRRAALDDPEGFVDHRDLVVIDEIQRVPELLLAIKAQVDADPRPGRFVLTGSARILGLRALPDTLPGRSETVQLWPFSQGEISSEPDGFVDALFRAEPGALPRHHSEITRSEYAQRIVRGGFPEAVARTNPDRRASFFDSYVADLVARDVVTLSEIEQPAQMRDLIRLVAARSGGLLVASRLSNDLRLTSRTVLRYLALLEEVFLIKRIPAWSRNISIRAIGTPKVAFVDSGVAANLLDADARSLLRPGGAFGPLLEGFVSMEIARQLTWSRRRVEMSHYRTKDGTEVDVVLEDRRGNVVGIEVKAATTVGPDDFRGLRHFADRVGPDLIGGIVLYTGRDTLSFGNRMQAMPIGSLWELAPPPR